MIGSNIFITNKFSFGNLITKLIREFKARVLADGGTFEAESCLKTQLESLNLTYPVTFVSSPVISGSTSVGSTITTTNGVVNGITPITYTYQWLLNGNPISGATNATYTVTGFDNGTLTCRVTGTNIYGAVFSISNQLTINNVFEFTINTNNTSAGSTANNQFALPLVNSLPLNAFVDWGDGSTDIITTFNQPERIHTYASAGTYTIKITGALSGWQFNNTGDRLKILNIASWGVLNISVVSGFFGCANLTATATDAPTISTTNLTNYFYNCINFNGQIQNWNVSNVTVFSQMFRSASAFNQNIGNWNVSNAVNMSAMFRGASAFNQNIGNWNVSNVTNFIDFMLSKTNLNYSASNLDAIYNGWSSRPVQPNISINFGTIRYTSASSAGRAILTGAPNNWSITDGGI